MIFWGELAEFYRLNTAFNMKHLMILLTSIMVSHLPAQDQKKTHDYQVFGERIAQALFDDLSSPIYGNSTVGLSDALAGRNSVLGYLVKNKELESLSATLGISVDELKEIRKQRRREIAYELTFIKMKYNHGIKDWEHAMLENVRIIEKENEKIKTADIVLEVKQGKNRINLVLENCIQTETKWLVGDKIYAEGSEGEIKENTQTANNLLAAITEPKIQNKILDVNGRWSSKKAIISYDNYPEKLILTNDQLRSTILRKLDFMLLNNGKLSIGVFLIKKDNYNAYSNKWSYREKSNSILFSSDEPGIFETRIVTVKLLTEREMVVEYSDMGATTTYFLNYSTPGRTELTHSEFENSEWKKLILEKIDLTINAKSAKQLNKVYKGLAVSKKGKIEEITVKYEHPLNLSNPSEPLYIYGEEYLGAVKPSSSAVSFMDKKHLRHLLLIPSCGCQKPSKTMRCGL